MLPIPMHMVGRTMDEVSTIIVRFPDMIIFLFGEVEGKFVFSSFCFALTLVKFDCGKKEVSLLVILLLP